MPPKKSINQVTPKDLSCDNISSSIPSTKIELTDKERRHAVVGIALNSCLIPHLKSYVDKQISLYYQDLVAKYKINSNESSLSMDIIRMGKLGLNIYDRKSKFLSNIYNHDELAKHYLQEFMSIGFKSIKDDGTDSSAILTMIISCCKFKEDIRYSHLIA